MKFTFSTIGDRTNVYAERSGKPRRLLGTLTMDPAERGAFELLFAVASRYEQQGLEIQR